MKEFDLLTFAIQDGGRLGPPSRELLSDAGYSFSFGEKVYRADEESGLPIRLFTLRNNDIPELVSRGKILMGITGQVNIIERGVDVTPLMDIPFGECSVVLGVAKDGPYKKPEDLAGKTVATSYPNITNQYFEEVFQGKKQGIDLEIMEGKVETAIPEGWADAIVDVRTTGASQRRNGIVPIDTVVMDAQIQLIASPNLGEIKGSERFVGMVIRDLLSVLLSRESVLIEMNVPKESRNEIRKLLPGLTAPTEADLADPNYISMKSVVAAELLREVQEQSLELGAEGILVSKPNRIVPNLNDREFVSIMRKIYGETWQPKVVR